MPAGILVLASLVPAIEEFNPASLAFIILALGIGLQLATHHQVAGLGQRAAALCDLYLIGPFRFLRDAAGTFNLPALTSGVIVWFIPVVLGSIFAFLFVSANPLLEKWISLINPGAAGSYLSVGTGTVLGSGIVGRLAIHPCLVAQQNKATTDVAETADAGAGGAIW